MKKATSCARTDPRADCLLQLGSWRLRVQPSRLWDRLLLAHLQKRRVTLCENTTEADAVLKIAHGSELPDARLAHQGCYWTLQSEGSQHWLTFDTAASRAMHRYMIAMDEALRRLLLDHSLLLLHAAAFQLDNGVTILAGEAGAGKSTLSLRAALTGGRLLSDDRVLLKHRDGLWISGCDSNAKLCDDAAETLFGSPPQGRRVVRGGVPKTEFPAAGRLDTLTHTDVRPDRLIFLRAGSALEMRPCSRATALIRLIEATRDELSLATREQRKASLDGLGALVESVPCYDLERPPGLESLDQAVGLVRSAP